MNEPGAGRRTRRLAWGTAVQLGARGLGILGTLVQVPIALSYLGEERFGIWATAVGTTQLLGLTDFGLGLGIQADVAEALGQHDLARARALLRRGYQVLSGIALALVLVVLGLWALCSVVLRLEWAASEQGLTALAAAFGFACGLPWTVPLRVAGGLQLSVQVGLAGALCSLFSLLAVAFAAWMRLSLPSLAALTAFSNYAGYLLLAWQVPRQFRGVCMPSSKLPSTWLRRGLGFFAPQAASAFVAGAPPILIGAALGATAVTQFSVSFRLVSVALQVPIVALGPLWAAYGEAYARGDRQWVKRAFQTSLGLCSVWGAAAGSTVFLFGAEVLSLWTKHPDVALPGAGMWALGVWTFLGSAHASLAIFLNGMNRLRGQSWAAVLTAVSILVVVPLAANAWGVSGAVWAVLGAWAGWTLPLTSRDAWALRGDLEAQEGLPRG